jgi:L-2,4-diaminobutyrate decarboxylase
VTLGFRDWMSFGSKLYILCPRMADRFLSDDVPILIAGKTIAEISKETWSLMQSLPSLLDQVYADGKNRSIVTVASAQQVARIKASAIPGTARPFEEVILEAQHIFQLSSQVQHPRFLSYIPSPVSPVSWMGDTLTSAFNVFSGSWDGGSGIASVEVALIAWLASQVGLPHSAGGLFVSGGSMAILTGLTVARDRTLKDDERIKGVAYMSDQTHFSVAKALRVLGFFDNQIRTIPSDSTFIMDIIELEKAILADEEKGLIPFAIVANFGSTNTGGIDPLDQIATLAQAHSMWLHVDGSYGASVSLSKSHRSLICGLDRADSISWDAHKWLFQTYGCGIVLVREKQHLSQSFSTTAEYVRDNVVDDETPNLWNYGIELTRPARHMRLWFTLQVLGLDAIGQMIDHGIMLAETAETELRKLPDWEICSPATMAIVNFRCCPPGWDELKLRELNSAISRDMISRNSAGIVTTVLRGKVCLRVCSISPLLKQSEMQQIVRDLDKTALKILATTS